MDTGADGNGVVGRTPRPGAGGRSRFYYGGEAVLERYSHGVGSGPASGYEA